MDIKRAAQEAINKLLGRDKQAEVAKEDIPSILDSLAVQAAQLSARMDEYRTLKRDADQIALYLRNNYADEIRQGKHTGLSLGDVVTMYLGRERELFKSTDPEPKKTKKEKTDFRSGPWGDAHNNE